MLIVFLLLVVVLLIIGRNLLLALLVLEILGFILIYFLSVSFSVYASSDYFVLIIFSVLVMEGVIALSGLISLVSFSGTDYLGLSAILNY